MSRELFFKLVSELNPWMPLMPNSTNFRAIPTDKKVGVTLYYFMQKFLQFPA